MKDVRNLAYCGVFAALSVAIMFLGGVFSFLSYSISGICGSFLVIIIVEMGKARAFFIYIVVSVLSLMFVSEKSIVFSYIFILGYYPILKVYIEKLNGHVYRYILKICLFLVALGFYVGLSIVFFEVRFFEEYGGWILLLGGFVFLVVALIYDFFLTIFKNYYVYMLKPKIFK